MWRLPVIGALLAGLSVLAMSVYLTLTSGPPLLGDADPATLMLRGGARASSEGLVDPTFMTGGIVLASFLGLVVVVFVEVMKPRERRMVRPSARRLQSFDLPSGPGER